MSAIFPPVFGTRTRQVNKVLKGLRANAWRITRSTAAELVRATLVAPLLAAFVPPGFLVGVGIAAAVLLLVAAARLSSN